jgi:hypothetical protein
MPRPIGLSGRSTLRGPSLLAIVDRVDQTNMKVRPRETFQHPPFARIVSLRQMTYVVRSGDQALEQFLRFVIISKPHSNPG